MLYQQGDVLFRSIEALPEKVKEIKQNGPIVVAQGETTGHAHKILDDVKAFLDEKDNMFLEIESPVTVVHEEHKPIELPEGIYMVDKVREYDHFQEESRRVRD